MTYECKFNQRAKNKIFFILLHAIFYQKINNNSKNLIAVHYGKNDDINAGDEGFKEFFEAYQNELDTIGKRPDILIFERKDFPYETDDISNFSNDILDSLVPKAKCGIEVRSSAFLIDKYESCMNKKITAAIESAMKSRDRYSIDEL